MRRVLVVDDEDSIRLVLKTLLKKQGYEVEVAESGDEALARENRALKEQIRQDHQYESILAKSGAMNDVFKTISKIADYKTTVLISGESGVGKELVARAIHSRGARKSHPFVAINCGAIP